MPCLLMDGMCAVCYLLTTIYWNCSASTQEATYYNTYTRIAQKIKAEDIMGITGFIRAMLISSDATA